MGERRFDCPQNTCVEPTVATAVTAVARSPAGSFKGRPLRFLYGALHRQEHRPPQAWHLRRKFSSLTPSVSPSLFCHGRHFGTGRSQEKITSLIREYFSLTPKSIIEALIFAVPIVETPPPTALSDAAAPSSPGSARSLEKILTAQCSRPRSVRHRPKPRQHPLGVVIETTVSPHGGCLFPARSPLRGPCSS